jgi:tyrosinase
VPSLPTTAQVAACLRRTRYDRAPYDHSSPDSFRNEAEGWVGQTVPGLHNRVHVWVGGDMGPGTSPNDPVFYLNHANSDRIWEAWMRGNGRIYEPDATAPDSLFRHRLPDPLVSMPTQAQPLISQTLDAHDLVDPARVPTYDALPTPT